MILPTVKALFISSRATTGYLIIGLITLLIGLVISIEGVMHLGERNPVFVVGPLLLATAILCFIKTAVARLAANKNTDEQVSKI